MNASHTPGPWNLVNDDGELSISVPATHYSDYVIAERIGGQVRQGPDGRFTDESEVEANARLIAAAPELLDALEMVRDYVVTMKQAGHEYQIAIDAAIAKARGEA